MITKHEMAALKNRVIEAYVDCDAARKQYGRNSDRYRGIVAEKNILLNEYHAACDEERNSK